MMYEKTSKGCVKVSMLLLFGDDIGWVKWHELTHESCVGRRHWDVIGCGEAFVGHF
jgi:hypothetical protein